MTYIGLYDDAGSKNAFYIILNKKIDRKRVGFKEFESKEEAEFAHKVQSILAEQDLAPRVYGQVGRIRRNNPDGLTEYGYLTEVARPMPYCNDEYCDGECFEGGCGNCTIIGEILWELDKCGLDYADHHRGNFGYVRRNGTWIPVVIDVGVESFSDWDSSIYGKFEYSNEYAY